MPEFGNNPELVKNQTLRMRSKVTEDLTDGEKEPRLSCTLKTKGAQIRFSVINIKP